MRMELSQIVDAFKLFVEMPKGDLTNWNLILTACVCACDVKTKFFGLFRIDSVVGQMNFFLPIFVFELFSLL